MESRWKLGYFLTRGGDEVAFHHADCLELQQTTGPERLALAPSSDHIGLIGHLAGSLPGPFGILYVLLVSRTDRDLGRYQMQEPLNLVSTIQFLETYREFLEQDGRHHIWLHSFGDNSTLVYDRHLIVYAYGPLLRLRAAAESRGLKEGRIQIPSPHAHRYHAEFDRSETDILDRFDWIRTDLQEGDDY